MLTSAFTNTFWRSVGSVNINECTMNMNIFINTVIIFCALCMQTNPNNIVKCYQYFFLINVMKYNIFFNKSNEISNEIHSFIEGKMLINKANKIELAYSNLFLWSKLNFQHHYSRFDAQETFMIIINVENSFNFRIIWWIVSKKNSIWNLKLLLH